MKKLCFIFLLVILLASCKDSTIVPNGSGEEKIPDGYAKVVYYVIQGDSAMELHRYYVDNGEDKLLKKSNVIKLLNKPANNKLFYVKKNLNENSYHICSCDLSGNNEKELFAINDTTAAFRQVSNDGTKILYVTETGVTYDGIVCDYNVHLANIDGTNDNIIYSNHATMGVGFSEFTPDSKNILIAHINTDNKTEIYFLEMNGSYLINKRKVNKDPLKMWSCGYFGNCSPDTKYLAVVNDLINITLLNTQTGDTVTILNNYYKNGGYIHGPIWSPNGQKICFWRNGGTFCVINPDGTNEIKLTEINSDDNHIIRSLSKHWSGDNKHILFSLNPYSSGSDIYNGDLRIADISTGEVKTIVYSKNVYSAYFLK